MGTADLHLHSAWSDGMATVRQIMERTEADTSLDVVAIADHDRVQGALEAVEWCAGRPAGRLQAVVATEISATWGRHVLALFFEEPYPTRPFVRFRSLARTVAMVQDAGGLVVVPHPLNYLVPSVGERTLHALLTCGRGMAAPLARQAVQAIEVCSGVVGGRRIEPRVRRLNDALWRLAPLGSSDAHHLAQIGSAFTQFPGRTPADLRQAILGRTTQACWGVPARVPLATHMRQSWRSLVVKPARELYDALEEGTRGNRQRTRGG